MERHFFHKQVITAAFAVLVLLIAGNSFVLAQNPVLLECVNMNKAYRNSSYLSFNVKYTYAKESTPTVIEDSSFVSYKVDGYKYWGSMDSVVFMQNDSFQVAVYRQEQVMALALPSYDYQSALPMAQWDSFFLKNNFTYSMGVDAGYKKITVDYNNLSTNMLKKYEIWYDSVTYRINHIKYKIDEAASNSAMAEEGVLSGVVMVVDVYFSNYQTGTFTNAVFNSGNYFTKTAGSYIPVSPYTSYEVFLVSPGL
jgi:hypothetical protein